MGPILQNEHQISTADKQSTTNHHVQIGKLLKYILINFLHYKQNSFQSYSWKVQFVVLKLSYILCIYIDFKPKSNLNSLMQTLKYVSYMLNSFSTNFLIYFI